MIPFIDLRPYVEKVAGYDPSSTRYALDLSEILDRREFIGRESVEKLERSLETTLDVKHAVACASGTAALSMALSTHGVGPQGMIAMPNVTFWSVYEAVVETCATPILIDIDPVDLQMSFSAFRTAYSRYRFHTVILPHMFGWASVRLDDFRSFCSENRILLVEDGAQAFGVRHNGVSVFKNAEVATLSFHPAKVIGGMMDGGAVLTRHIRTAETVKLLRDHGRTGHYEHMLVGYNSRMSGINAMYLNMALACAQEIISARRELVDRYALCRSMKMTVFDPNMQHRDGNGYLNVMTTALPGAEVQRRLLERGVECGRIYPKPISEQRGAQHAIRFGDLAQSRLFCDRVVNLPLYYGMTSDLERAVEALDEILS